MRLDTFAQMLSYAQANIEEFDDVVALGTFFSQCWNRPDFERVMQDHQQDVWEQICALLPAAMTVMDAGNLVSCLYGLSKAQRPISQPFLQHWCACALPKLPDFTAQGLTKSIYSLAQFSMQDPTLVAEELFVRAWSLRVLEEVEQMQAQNFGNCWWALGRMAMRCDRARH